MWIRHPDTVPDNIVAEVRGGIPASGVIPGKKRAHVGRRRITASRRAYHDG